jgi:hypothetical protein
MRWTSRASKTRSSHSNTASLSPNGDGGLSQVDFTTINGVPTGKDWRAGTGSYEINADCTGKAQITPADGSPTLRLRLVVADRGDLVKTIVEGNATGSSGTRVR